MNSADLLTFRELHAENERLREALELARDHIRFNSWQNDPKADRRAAALKELDAALGDNR